MRTQAAIQQVLFGGDDRAALFRRLRDGRFVHGLDSVHIKHARVDAFIGKLRLRLQRVADLQPAGDDGCVASVAVLLGFADLKRVIGAVDDGSFGASGAHVNRANVLGHAMHQRARAEFVGRIKHHKSGQCTHECVIFHRLLAGAVLANGDAAMRAHKLGVHVRIRHAHAELVITFIAEKDRERRREGQLAGKRQPAGNRYHVGLSDAHSEEAFRIFLLELCAEGGLGQIGIQRNDIGIALAQLNQRLPVGFARGDTHLQFEFRFGRGYRG